MDNYYPQMQSYGRKPDPPRYDLCFVKGRKWALEFEMGPNSRTPEIYGELTKDWIEDEDAVTEKATAYYTHVVDHD